MLLDNADLDEDEAAFLFAVVRADLREDDEDDGERLDTAGEIERCDRDCDGGVVNEAVVVLFGLALEEVDEDEEGFVVIILAELDVLVEEEGEEEEEEEVDIDITSDGIADFIFSITSSTFCS